MDPFSIEYRSLCEVLWSVEASIRCIAISKKR